MSDKETPRAKSGPLISVWSLLTAVARSGWEGVVRRAVAPLRHGDRARRCGERSRLVPELLPEVRGCDAVCLERRRDLYDEILQLTILDCGKEGTLDGVEDIRVEAD